MKKEFKFSYQYVNSVDELTAEQQKTVSAAEKAAKNAYAPYSRFKVGAALLLKDDTIVIGSNQENKAYPTGLCAERVALFSYGAQQKKQGIKSIAIVGDGDLLKAGDIFSPCGACRQAMAEYTDMQGESFEIILKNGDGSFTIFEGIRHLLPFIFGS
ncbi:cytidine deaminase [Brumimicrobium salinarum]|uniref:Cytidine deaminase n=1 Tax=Brumimicrobium salinarum TaxID=2058658 RepID=A0A2I0R3C5_9FLAO|nr:cytidine deaminase [Brumimicrobium salinarum]PKR81059.1 cytidine deaminase [Brumimicrobium salinarum]